MPLPRPIWKPPGKAVRPFEYGYEAASWRRKAVVVPVKDNMESSVKTADAEFRPPIKPISSGTSSFSDKWKASRQHIDSSRGKDFQWRPSVRTYHSTHEMVHEMDKSQVLADLANTHLETNQGNFKPIQQNIFPGAAGKQLGSNQQKRHITVLPEWIPPFRLQAEGSYKAAPRRNGKGMVNEYGAAHPPLSLAWDATSQPGNNVLSATVRQGSSAYPGHGETSLGCSSIGTTSLARSPIGPASTRKSGLLSHSENRSAGTASPTTPSSLKSPTTPSSLKSDKVTPLSEMKEQYRRWR